ncbi:MAG: efflux RND transporter periplasmic adaptor subunit [Myxococcota bacterium]
MKGWASIRTSLVVAAATLGVACGGGEEAAEVAAPRVVVAPVATRDLDERILASGELLAVHQAEIAAEIDGRVTELLVEEGDPVSEGTPLLRIDPERRELELADARAQVAEVSSTRSEAAREHGRIQKLEARGAASASQLDAAETALQAASSRLQAAEARLGVAERALRDATVTAPFAGVVARRPVDRGEYVRPGQMLLELVALDPIEVEFHLSEADSSRVALDQPVAVGVAPHPGETFQARVTMISPTIDPTSRTLRVKAVLANPGVRLRPGLFARADLGVAHRVGVPMIPEEAVLQRAEGPVVFALVADSRVERRRIEVGRHHGGEVEVLSGLGEGDWVAIRGHTRLLDGAVVAAQDTEGRPPATPLAKRTGPAAAAEALP